MSCLADGRRDPLNRPTLQPKIAVRAIGRNTVEFVGCDRAVYVAITAVCARYQRAPRGSAWLVKQDDADNVLARLEAHGYQLEARL